MSPHHASRAADAHLNTSSPARRSVRIAYQSRDAEPDNAANEQQQPMQQPQDQARRFVSSPSPLTHQQLLDLGASFVHAWFGGVARGPAAVNEQLLQVLEPSCILKADGVRYMEDVEGLGGLLAEQERLHLEYHDSTYTVILTAASQETQRAYALVLVRYQDVGARPGHPATFRISHVHHILALQADPETGRIDKLWLRRQLTEEDKEELLVDPVHCYPAPFPKHLLQPCPAGEDSPVERSQLAAAIQSWWGSWANKAAPMRSGQRASAAASNGASSRPSKQQQAQQASQGLQLARDFRLYDAMGLFRAMRDSRSPASRRYMSREGALRYRSHLQRQYNIGMRVMDVAPAEDGQLAAFTHWQATFTQRPLQDQPPAPADKAAAGPEVNGGAASAAEVPAPGAGMAAGGSSVVAGATDVSTSDGSSQQEISAPARSQQRRQRGRRFMVEGLEVDLFRLPRPGEGSGGSVSGSRPASPGTSQDGAATPQLSAIWQFRTPLDREERLLSSAYRAAMEAEHAMREEAEQQARIQAREAQLRELYDTMAAYQARWESAMAHVQSAISRQQERLEEVRQRVAGRVHHQQQEPQQHSSPPAVQAGKQGAAVGSGRIDTDSLSDRE